MASRRWRIFYVSMIEVLKICVKFWERFLTKIGTQSLVMLIDALQGQDFTLVAYKRGLCLTDIRHFLEAMAVVTLRDHAQSNQALRCKFDFQVVFQQTSSACNGLQSGASLGNLPSTSNQSMTPHVYVDDFHRKPTVQFYSNVPQNFRASKFPMSKFLPKEMKAFQFHPCIIKTIPWEGLAHSGSVQHLTGTHSYPVIHPRMIIPKKLEKALYGDKSSSDFDFYEDCWVGSCNAVENSAGLSSVNEAHNIYNGGFSAASEAGSVSYGGLSPAGEVGSRRYIGPIRFGGFSQEL
uniref:Uncharacterized protein n=1 Tax=Leersia perrieri TaxID=77586 RepID=A0A0D9XV11_9ORYZ